MRLSSTKGRERARILRRESTLPERILWHALRTHGDARWRRQHPIGPFVVDLFCHAAALVVEVDGEAHERGDAEERDGARDRWLAASGLRVVRFAARDVLTNLDGVILAIDAYVQAALPLRQPAAATSPGGGGAEAP